MSPLRASTRAHDEPVSSKCTAATGNYPRVDAKALPKHFGICHHPPVPPRALPHQAPCPIRPLDAGQSPQLVPSRLGPALPALWRRHFVETHVRVVDLAIVELLLVLRVPACGHHLHLHAHHGRAAQRALLLETFAADKGLTLLSSNHFDWQGLMGEGVTQGM